MVRHALKRKTTFDQRVLTKSPGEVIFEKGALIQIKRSNLENTFKMDRKLAPRWSIPHRITKRLWNSYELEALDGSPIPNTFPARQLRRFTPIDGTQLDKEQKEFERLLIERNEQDENMNHGEEANKEKKRGADEDEESGSEDKNKEDKDEESGSEDENEEDEDEKGEDKMDDNEMMDVAGTEHEEQEEFEVEEVGDHQMRIVGRSRDAT
jgi:hypothetical protein